MTGWPVSVDRSRRAPAASIVEARARRRLRPDALAYLEAGSGREETVTANRRAWEEVALWPRVLRDVTTVDPTTTLLGTAVALPIAIAPVGHQRLFHPDGEAATAAAAAERAVLHIVSTRCSRPLAEIAVSGAPFWFQVYVLQDRGLTLELVAAARDLGARALVLTVDTPVPGTKPRCPELPIPDSMLFANLPGPVAARDPTRWDRITQAADVTPETVAWLAEHSGLPVVVKGVLHPDDARAAVSAGARAIVVSNHGGRQLDGAVASARALPLVVDAVGDRVEVYVDGGIGFGVDVVRALALGARAALVGRAAMLGLAAGGADGVAGVLDRLEAELVEAMRLCGATRVAVIGGDLLQPGPGHAVQVAPGGTR